MNVTPGCPYRRPRAIAASYARTASFIPTNTASATTACPMLSSTISRMATSAGTFSCVNPWPAATSIPPACPRCAPSARRASSPSRPCAYSPYEADLRDAKRPRPLDLHVVRCDEQAHFDAGTEERLHPRRQRLPPGDYVETSLGGSLLPTLRYEGADAGFTRVAIATISSVAAISRLNVR